MSSSSSMEDGQVWTVWPTAWWINATSEARVLKDPEMENLAIMIDRSSQNWPITFQGTKEMSEWTSREKALIIIKVLGTKEEGSESACQRLLG